MVVNFPLEKRWPRGAVIAGLCLWLVTHITPLHAQEVISRGPIQITPQVLASYFPLYVADDAQTQRKGIDVGARIGRSSGLGLKLGYTYVPQETTTSSSAPRLRAVRALVSGSVRLEPNSSVTLFGGVGAARVTVETQHIDCGDFPVCAEWAPRSGTWTLPTVEVGAVVEVWDRIGWLLQATFLIPHGEAWSGQGDADALAQFSTGVSVRIGSGG